MIPNQFNTSNGEHFSLFSVVVFKTTVVSSRAIYNFITNNFDGTSYTDNTQLIRDKGYVIHSI